MGDDLSYHDYCFSDELDCFRQKELTIKTVYDTIYVRDRYEPIVEKVRAMSIRRLGVLEGFYPTRGALLDYGCGTGTFVRTADCHGWDAFGYDVADFPCKHKITRQQILEKRWDVVTFFDSLEHLIDPKSVIKELSPRVIMISVPWCHYPHDPAWFMQFHHRKPFEHLRFWNPLLLDRFMKSLGYSNLMHSNFEDSIRTPHTDDGLQNILTSIYTRY